MKLPDLQIDDSMCCEVPEGVGTAELLAVLAAYLAYLASWLTLQVPLLLHSCETCHLIGEDDSMFLFFFMKWKPVFFVHEMETRNPCLSQSGLYTLYICLRTKNP